MPPVLSEFRGETCEADVVGLCRALKAEGLRVGEEKGRHSGRGTC